METNKYINENNNYDFDFIKDDKVLIICQDEDEENIYLACRYIDYRTTSNIIFEIAQDDAIYPIINETYESIVEEYNKDRTKYKKMLKKGIATIYCDSHDLQYPNILRMHKTNESIKLEFDKVEGKGVLFKPAFTIFINFKKQEGKIPNISNAFHTMYKEMQDIEITKNKTLIRK